MTTDNKSELAALRREVAELKAAVAPKPEPDWKERERTDAEHRDRVHAMRERQANSWMPPNAVQAMVEAEPRGFMSGVVRDNRNAPTSPTGMIPSTQSSGGAVRGAGDGTGYVDPRPLRPPPGIEWVDAIAIADEVRKRKLGEG
jgi:hypothetical protein